MRKLVGDPGFNHLAAENAGPGSDVLLAGDPIPHAALEPRHKGDATGLQLVKPLEMEVEARSATTTLPASNVHVRATVTSPVSLSVTLTKLGRWPAWSNPTCSLIAGRATSG